MTIAANTTVAVVVIDLCCSDNEEEDTVAVGDDERGAASLAAPRNHHGHHRQQQQQQQQQHSCANPSTGNTNDHTTTISMRKNSNSTAPPPPPPRMLPVSSCTFSLDDTSLSRCRKRKVPLLLQIDDDDDRSFIQKRTALEQKKNGPSTTQSSSIPLFIFINGDDSHGSSADTGTITLGLLAAWRHADRIHTNSNNNKSRTTFATGAGHTGTDSTMPHIQQHDRWSCGYRNLQMLFGAVLSLLPANHSYYSYYHRNNNSTAQQPRSQLLIQQQQQEYTLADGFLCIPSVHQLQQLLEAAWTEGYDPMGATHYRHSILHSTAQIGAIEVSTCLTFAGIDNVVVQFIACPESRSKLAPFCAAYYTNQHRPASCSSSSGSTDCSTGNADQSCGSGSSSSEMARRLLSHERPDCHEDPYRMCSCASLPLYLQWKGHSVSIIGVEWQMMPCQNNKTNSPVVQNLLVFDPNKSGAKHKLSIDKGDVKPFRLAVAKLETMDCQIIVSSTQSLSLHDQMLRKAEGHTLTAAHESVQKFLSLSGRRK